MFALPSLRAASVASLALLGSAFGFFFLASMFLQLAAGFSSLEAGFALLPMSIVSALVSATLAPLVAGRLGARPTLVAGLALNTLGVLLFMLADPAHALAMTIIASVVLGGFGMGLGYPASNLVALEGIDASLQGAASGIQNTCLQTGGAIGTALAATVLSSFGAPFASLGPADQMSARTLAAVVLASLALLGALALVTSRRAVGENECVCETSPNA
jgi:MFS family permease